MKEFTENKQLETFYEAPFVEVVEVVVEKGFATSMIPEDQDW